MLIVKIDCQRAILSINHPVKPLLAGGPDRNRTCDTRFRNAKRPLNAFCPSLLTVTCTPSKCSFSWCFCQRNAHGFTPAHPFPRCRI